MRDLGARRRPQPERELARRVECVLKGRQPLEDTVLVEELRWIRCDRLELRQRPGEALPQARERCCVPLALPTRDARSHSPILTLGSRPHGGSRKYRARRRRRRQSANALPRQPRTRGLPVLEAPTVERAETLLHDEAVDVVLLDVHVGAGDGFKVLDGVGGERVALFTGSFEVDEHHAAAVDAVLRKPFTLTELSETVGRLADAGTEL